MVQRHRGPQFDPVHGLRVTDLGPDEVVIREEWTRRRRAREMAEQFDPPTREAIRLRDQEWEVRPDDEVSTDAAVAANMSVDGWHVRWTFAMQEGQLVARSVHVAPVDRSTPPGGVTGDVLRALSPSRSASVVGREYLYRTVHGTDLVSRLLQNVAEAQIDAGTSPQTATARRRPGRPPLPDELLCAVALAYLDELGQGRGLINRIAQRLDVPADTARDWVRAARREGFLTPATKQGRKGASAGPRLMQYLEGEES